MSLKVIELNDSAVSVSDETGVLLQSPGFALVFDRGLDVGVSAERQARLKPTNSFNKFWQQLSLEPLGYAVGNVRHFADLAYAHLLHIAKEANVAGEVIFAVPGNFTSQQIAILLGLARQSPFSPVGVVDAALVKTIGLADSPNVVFADIQLHQTLLTRFAVNGGELERVSVVQIQDNGLQQFWDQIMQLATSLFIQQCRFNPQHNAESEQQLYNSLPEWFRQQGKRQDDLEMEIKTGQAVYQAKMPWDTLQRRLAQFFDRIDQKILQLNGDSDNQIVVSSALSELPGFGLSAPTVSPIRIATPEVVGRNCIDFQARINSSEDGFQFVTRLPLAGEAVIRQKSASASEAQSCNEPTHVLFNSQALPLGKVTVNNDGENASGGVNGSGKVIHLALNGLPAYLGQIEREGNRVFIICGEAGALVNGEKVSGKRQLALGDSIRFDRESSEITLIRVQDGVA